MRPLLLLSIALATALAQAQEQSVVLYDQAFFAPKNPRTALDMVNLLPGFVLALGDNSVRGYSASAGNVLIDGERPSDKQFGLDTVLAHIPADQVDDVEVIRGGRPDIDMLGQSVVANVVRRKAAADSAVATLSHALYDDGRGAPSLTVEATRHLEGGRQISGAVSASRYIELAEGNGFETIGNSRTAIASRAGGVTAYGYGVYETPAWGGKLSVNASLARTDYSFHETDSAATTTELRDYLGGPLGGLLKGELGSNYQARLGEHLTGEALLLADLQGQTYSSRSDQGGVAQFFSERDHRGESLARGTLHYQALPDLTAELVAEGAYNWLGTDNAFFYGSDAVTLPNARASISELRGQTGLHLIWSATATLQLEATEQIEFSSIAARADVRQSRELVYAKPRFAATWTPDAENQMRLRIEREVGQLNFSDFVAASSLVTGAIRSGNTDILPQRDWAFEIAYDRHFWSDSDASISLRRLALAEIVDRVPVYPPADPAAVFDAPGNIGAGSQTAATLNVTIGLDRLGIGHGQLKLSGTRQWSRATDPTDGGKRPISDLEPLEYSIAFRQDMPDWNAAWGWSLATPCALSATVKGCGKSEYRFDEIDRFHAAPALGLFAEYRPDGETLLRFEADNVLKQHYRQDDSFYNGARGAVPLSYSEKRDLISARSFLLSLRRSF